MVTTTLDTSQILEAALATLATLATLTTLAPRVWVGLSHGTLRIVLTLTLKSRAMSAKGRCSSSRIRITSTF